MTAVILSDDELNRLLKRLGWGQRIFGGIIAGVAIPLILMFPGWHVLARSVAILLALAPFVLSFRIRVVLSHNCVIVRSHVVTRRFPLSDILFFSLDAYEGWWNGGVGSKGWGNFNLHMIAVVRRTRSDGDLPETMCLPRLGEQIVRALNSRLEQTHDPL